MPPNVIFNRKKLLQHTQTLLPPQITRKHRQDSRHTRFPLEQVGNQ